MTKDYVRIGRILRPQGIRGEVKVELLTNHPERFDGLTKVFVEKQGSYQELILSSSDLRGNNAYLSFQGVNTRDLAEPFRNTYVCLRREDAKLPEDRWFIDDLIGCAVEDDIGNVLGKLSDVLQYGSADVYVISGQKGLMVPALKTLLLNVDIEQKRIILDSTILAQVAVWDD